MKKYFIDLGKLEEVHYFFGSAIRSFGDGGNAVEMVVQFAQCLCQGDYHDALVDKQEDADFIITFEEYNIANTLSVAAVSHPHSSVASNLAPPANVVDFDKFRATAKFDPKPPSKLGALVGFGLATAFMAISVRNLRHALNPLPGTRMKGLRKVNAVLDLGLTTAMLAGAGHQLGQAFDRKAA